MNEYYDSFDCEITCEELYVGSYSSISSNDTVDFFECDELENFYESYGE